MPASTSARASAFSWAGPSEISGRIGAASTPVGTPASRSRASASSRRRGWGVPGSLNLHTSSSTVPTENAVCTRVRRAASASTSRSRRMSVDFVRIENGLRASPSTSTIPRVSRYLPSHR